ncbi:MAG TPA: hypothetical protein VLI90_14135 [Tepidisphaeraceae bacterium]|nr:hypothetical protein [Tepidisphaeraceae bacterium]
MTSILFALWVVAMLVMYFSTVYPERHPNQKAALSATTKADG